MRPFQSELNNTRKFLAEKIVAGEYGLQCNDAEGKPTRLNGTGHIVSACFIAEAMGAELSELVRSVLLTRLLSEEVNGLWGYAPRGYRTTKENEMFLTDADDTAFAIRAFRALGVYKNPEPLLSYFDTRYNAFRTFNSATTTAAYSPEQSIAMHFALHPDVNANVLTALHGSDFEKNIGLDWVNKWQNESGFFESYFYPDHFYTTATFVNYLQHYPEYWPNIQKAMKYIAETQNDDGSWGALANAGYTAWALKILSNATQHYEPNIKRALNYLMLAQNKDGSWQNDSLFWRFYNPGSELFWNAKDSNRIITSTLCLEVLNQLLPGQ